MFFKWIMIWKMTHPQTMEIFVVQKYFLLLVQHNIIEFQKHKRSDHPNKVTFAVVIKIINMSFDGERMGGRMSVSILTYFLKQKKVTEKNANVTNWFVVSQWVAKWNCQGIPSLKHSEISYIRIGIGISTTCFVSFDIFLVINFPDYEYCLTSSKPKTVRTFHRKVTLFLQFWQNISGWSTIIELDWLLLAGMIFFFI